MNNRRGPYAKGAAKREEILAVALEVIAESLCRKTSNREIARRVGLSQAGLMHYFESREELYLEVLRVRDEETVARFWVDDPTIESYLRVIAHNATVPGLVRLFAEYSAEATIEGHPAREFFRSRTEWVRDMLAGAIERERAAGGIGPNLDAAEAAGLLIAASDGMQLQWLVDPSIDMAAHVRRLWLALSRSSF